MKSDRSRLGFAVFLIGLCLVLGTASLVIGTSGISPLDSMAGIFGQADPIFGKDIGFYLFRLPFYELLRNSLAGLTLMTLTIVAGYVFHIGLAVIVFGLAQHILFIRDLFGVSFANLNQLKKQKLRAKDQLARIMDANGS